MVNVFNICLLTEKMRLFPSVFAVTCFSLGIIISQYMVISAGILFFLPICFFCLSFITLRKRVSAIFILLAFLLTGACYCRNYQVFPENHVSRIAYYYFNNPVEVEGVVVSDVEKRPFFKNRKNVFTLDIRRMKLKNVWMQKQGRMLVNLFRDDNISYGDYVLLEGKVHRPFNFSKDTAFSYRDYLYRKGITLMISVKKNGRAEVLRQKEGSFLADKSFFIKHRLSAVLDKYLPEKEAGMMQAFLLGDRYNIPKNIYELFRLSGVVHIVAISGFNIGIVAYMIFLILKIFPIPRNGQYLLTIVFLVFYAFITGGQPPVVRATIMAVIFLTSFIIEREHDPINTLSWAAFILLLMNPLNLFDVGFQLSFISVLSIILFYPRWLKFFYKCFALPEDGKVQENYCKAEAVRLKVAKYFLQSIALSLAAYLGVLALVIYYFHIFTPIVILANMVVVPVSSLIIFLGMGLLLMGVVCPFFAFAFAHCISALLNFMVLGVAFFAQIPMGVFFLKDVTVLFPIIYYFLMAVVYCFVRMIDKPDRVC